MSAPKRGIAALVLALTALLPMGPPAAYGAPAEPPRAPSPQPADADPEADPANVIVRFRPGVRAEEGSATVARRGLRLKRRIGATGHFLVSTEGKPPAAAVRNLRGDARVVEAELNHRVKAAVTPNDPRFATHQAYLANLGLPTAWDRSRGSMAVPVAVVDSGIDFDHPELVGRVLPGWDFVTGDPVAEDDYGHGTWVSGVVGAATNNAQGVAGAAWDTSIIPVKVLDEDGNGWAADVADGIAWAADHGAKVVNLSLGNEFYSPVIRDAVGYAQSRDAVVVAAAGNECSSQPFYPAAYPGVVAVTATDHDGRFAGPPTYSCEPPPLGRAQGFSNSGPWISLAAPGKGITSTLAGEGEQYGTVEGTSFSAPIVVGVAVLVRAQQPGLTQSQVVTRLRDTARDAGPPGFDEQYGYGWVDPTAALGGTPYPPLTAPSDGEFHAVAPARILDTRNGMGAALGPTGPGQEVRLQVTGRGGVPTSGVSAVVVNVTVTEPTAASHLTVYPYGQPRPLASNLNYVPGQTVPNLVTVKVGAQGQIVLFHPIGQAHLVADVAGWYSDASGPRGDRYHALPPSRLLDTRGGPAGPVGQGESRALQVTGRGGVPTSGVSAVVMNVTVTEPTAPSHLTVYPGDRPRPLASNLNYVAGQTFPNLVTVRVGQTPPGGQVMIFNSTGRTHVVVDVMGWYGDESNGPGRLYRPTPPARILDTRYGTSGVVGPVGQALEFRVTGRGGVPPTEAGVSAVVMNVTVTEPNLPSHLTVYPGDRPRPLASNLNYVAGQTVPNLVVVKVGAGGTVRVHNNFGSLHLIFDVVGWFPD